MDGASEKEGNLLHFFNSLIYEAIIFQFDTNLIEAKFKFKIRRIDLHGKLLRFLWR